MVKATKRRRCSSVRRTVFSSGLLILCGAANAAAFAQLGGPGGGGVQSLPTPVQIGQTQISADSYQGSVADSKLVPGVLPLSLDDAIEPGRDPLRAEPD